MAEFQAKLDSLNIRNVKVSKWSKAPIWAGSSLLDLHLKFMDEVLKYKQQGIWDWDYVMNLSESDFPIKYSPYLQNHTFFVSKFKKMKKIYLWKVYRRNYSSFKQV